MRKKDTNPSIYPSPGTLTGFKRDLLVDITAGIVQLAAAAAAIIFWYVLAGVYGHLRCFANSIEFLQTPHADCTATVANDSSSSVEGGGSWSRTWW